MSVVSKINDVIQIAEFKENLQMFFTGIYFQKTTLNIVNKTDWVNKPRWESSSLFDIMPPSHIT